MEAENAVATEEQAQPTNRLEKAKAGTTLNRGEENEQEVSAEATWAPGNNLTEAVEMYGEETVFELYVNHGTRNLSNSIRSLLAAGIPPDQVQEKLQDWRPDTSLRVTRAPEDNVLANWSKLSPEKQQELLQKLMAQATGDENGEEG